MAKVAMLTKTAMSRRDIIKLPQLRRRLQKGMVGCNSEVLGAMVA